MRHSFNKTTQFRVIVTLHPQHGPRVAPAQLAATEKPKPNLLYRFDPRRNRNFFTATSSQRKRAAPTFTSQSH